MIGAVVVQPFEIIGGYGVILNERTDLRIVEGSAVQAKLHFVEYAG